MDAGRLPEPPNEREGHEACFLHHAVRVAGIAGWRCSRAEASGHLGLTESEVMAAIGAVNDVIEALTGKPWAKSVPKAQGGEK